MVLKSSQWEDSVQEDSVDPCSSQTCFIHAFLIQTSNTLVHAKNSGTLHFWAMKRVDQHKEGQRLLLVDLGTAP